MRQKTSIERHAADLAFFFTHAAKKSQHIAEHARSPEARDQARKLQDAAVRLRERARELEAVL